MSEVYYLYGTILTFYINIVQFKMNLISAAESSEPGNDQWKIIPRVPETPLRESEVLLWRGGGPLVPMYLRPWGYVPSYPFIY